MSAGKVTVVLLFILLLVWLVLLTLGNLGLMPGSTQKYVKDRKWDKMREMLEDLYKADGTEDETVCKEIRDWGEENQDDFKSRFGVNFSSISIFELSISQSNYFKFFFKFFISRIHIRVKFFDKYFEFFMNFLPF